MLAASVVSFFSIPFFGRLSDRIGRRNMYMLGAFLAVSPRVLGFLRTSAVHVSIAVGMLVAGLAAAEIGIVRARYTPFSPDHGGWRDP